MESVDLADVHGGLLALTEIAIAYKGVENVDEREKCLQNVSPLGGALGLYVTICHKSS